MTLLKGCTQSERRSPLRLYEMWGCWKRVSGILGRFEFLLFLSFLVCIQNLAIRGEVSIKHVYVKSDFALLAGGHRHLAQSSESLSFAWIDIIPGRELH
jgi:hypothetical protein